MAFTDLSLTEETLCLMISLAFEQGELEHYSHFIQDAVQVVVMNPQLQKILVYHDGNTLNGNVSAELHAAIDARLTAMCVEPKPVIHINADLEETSDSPMECYATALQKNTVDKTTWLMATDSALSNEDAGQLVELKNRSPDLLHIEHHEIAPLILVPIPDDVTTLAVSFDFDGCTDDEEARRRWIVYLCELLRANRQIQHLKVFIGSLRQSVFIDVLNAVSKGLQGDLSYQSCKVLGVELIDQSRHAIAQAFGAAPPPTIEFIPLLNSDVLNQLEVGTTFHCLNQGTNTFLGEQLRFLVGVLQQEGKIATDISLEEINARISTHHEAFNAHLTSLGYTHTDNHLPVRRRDGSEVSLLHSRGVLYDPGTSCSFEDQMKTTTIWLQAQYLDATTHNKYALLFSDDRADILASLTTFYKNNKSLLPERCYFHGLQFADYEGSDTLRPTHNLRFLAPIQGTGLANPQYEAAFQKLVAVVPTCKNPDALIKAMLKKYGHCTDPLQLSLAPPVNAAPAASTIVVTAQPPILKPLALRRPFAPFVQSI